MQRTALISMPRLEGQERAAGPKEAELRRANPGSVAVDTFWRTERGEGPLTNLVYEMRRMAAYAEARAAAERVAERSE